MYHFQRESEFKLYPVEMTQDEVDMVFSYRNRSHRRMDKMIRGALYRLRSTVSVHKDLTYSTERFYRCIAKVSKIGDEPIRGCVMRLERGTTPQVAFCLSPAECRLIHVSYEPGLALFPDTVPFERVVERFPPLGRPLSAEDASTLPTSPIDGTIRGFLLGLEEFSELSFTSSDCDRLMNGDRASHVLWGEKGARFVIERDDDSSSLILRGLRLSLKRNLYTRTFSASKRRRLFRKGEALEYCILPFGGHPCIFIPVLTNTKGYFTEDGLVGVDAGSLRGVAVSDIFDVVFK